jgi:hypothetical protein
LYSSIDRNNLSLIPSVPVPLVNDQFLTFVTCSIVIFLKSVFFFLIVLWLVRPLPMHNLVARVIFFKLKLNHVAAPLKKVRKLKFLTSSLCLQGPGWSYPLQPTLSLTISLQTHWKSSHSWNISILSSCFFFGLFLLQNSIFKISHLENISVYPI